MVAYVSHFGVDFNCYCSVRFDLTSVFVLMPLWFSFAEANEWSQMYGILLMPVAIAFCFYSLWMYIKRAGMIRRKDPGPCKIACTTDFEFFRSH